MNITRPTKILAAAIAGLTMGTAAVVAGAGGGSAPTAEYSADPTSTTIRSDAAATNARSDTGDTTGAPSVRSSGGDELNTSTSGHDTDDTTDDDASETADQGGDEPADPEQPADEVDEPAAPGEPGVIHRHGGRSEPAPPPPPGAPSDLASISNAPPPPPPIPAPVDIGTPLPGPDPEPIDDLVLADDPTPIPGPSDLQSNPTPSHLGEVSSGLTGCQLDCVTSALLSANPANPNVTLAVETTVPVHFEIEVTETGTDSSQLFNSPGYDTAYDFDISPLKKDTTYDLMMIAIDQDGHSQVYEHQFTTVDILDGFVGNAEGCALDCITTGVVNKTNDFSTIEIHVETNSPAAMQVWVSTEEPTWVDDPDAKPAYGEVLDADTPSTSWTFDVPGLDETTTYHVVARAEDDHGVHFRVGEFTTDEDPDVNVQVGFERITVTHDGDKHSLNRGELSFGWGFDGEPLGWRAEEKMHAVSFDIGSGNTTWFSIDADDGAIPNPMLNAQERDWDGIAEFCSIGNGLDQEPTYRSKCDSKSNVAMFGYDIRLADIEQMDSCLAMGITTAGIDSRCAAISSSTHGSSGDDYAHFIAYISFVVA